MAEFLLLPAEKCDELVNKLNRIEELVINMQNVQASIQGWLSEKQVQKFLNVGATTLWTLRKRKDVEYSKIGSRIFYKIDSIVKLLDKHSG